MDSRDSSRSWILFVAMTAGVAGVIEAQHLPAGFGVSMGFGYTRVAGEWGQALTDGIDADINLTYLFSSGVRVGLGAYYVSYHVKPGFGDEQVNNVQLQSLLGYSWRVGRWRPYGQLRMAYVRLRLEGHFGPGPPPPIGENSQPRRHGVGGVALVGIESAVATYVSIDANLWYGLFATQTLDLIEINGPEFSDGRSWGLRVGVTWYTDP